MSKIFLADSKSNDVRIGRLLETFRAKIKAYPTGSPLLPGKIYDSNQKRTSFTMS